MALSVLGAYEANIGGNVLAMIYGDMATRVIGDVTLQGNNNELKSVLATTIQAGTTMSMEAGAGVSINGKTVDVQAKTIMNLTANSVINISSSTVNIGKGVPIPLVQLTPFVAGMSTFLTALSTAVPSAAKAATDLALVLSTMGTTNTKAS